MIRLLYSSFLRKLLLALVMFYRFLASTPKENSLLLVNFKKSRKLIFSCKGTLFIVVLFPPQDSHCPVELFGEEEPDHLVAESHFTEGEFAVGAVVDRRWETVGSAYQENQAPVRHLELAVEPVREVDTTVLFARFVEEDQAIVIV